MCITPYHPIRGQNAATLWDFTIYHALHNESAVYQELAPNYEQTLTSGDTVVIQWDPWPSYSGEPNVIAHAVSKGLLPADRADGVALAIFRKYRLVQWKSPIFSYEWKADTWPIYDYGGGRFLVRKDIPLSSEVQELNPTAILAWRDEE